MPVERLGPRSCSSRWKWFVISTYVRRIHSLRFTCLSSNIRKIRRSKSSAKMRRALLPFDPTWKKVPGG
jgi:hypothetical protein